MTVAGPAAEGAADAESNQPEPKRNKIKTGEGRLALLAGRTHRRSCWP